MIPPQKGRLNTVHYVFNLADNIQIRMIDVSTYPARETSQSTCFPYCPYYEVGGNSNMIYYAKAILSRMSITNSI